MIDAADSSLLLAAAQRGDTGALDAFLRLHYDRILHICRRITGNDADAADATQEAMLAIVRGLNRFDGRASVTTWLFGCRSLKPSKPRTSAPLQLNSVWTGSPTTTKLRCSAASSSSSAH